MRVAIVSSAARSLLALGGAIVVTACTTAHQPDAAKSVTSPAGASAPTVRAEAKAYLMLLANDLEDLARACAARDAAPLQAGGAFTPALVINEDAKVTHTFASGGGAGYDKRLTPSRLIACIDSRVKDVRLPVAPWPVLARPPLSLVSTLVHVPEPGAALPMSHREISQHLVREVNARCSAWTTREVYLVQVGFVDGKRAWSRNEAGPVPNAAGLECIERAVAGTDFGAFLRGRGRYVQLAVPYFFRGEYFDFPLTP